MPHPPTSTPSHLYPQPRYAFPNPQNLGISYYMTKGINIADEAQFANQLTLKYIIHMGPV